MRKKSNRTSADKITETVKETVKSEAKKVEASATAETVKEVIDKAPETVKEVLDKAPETVKEVTDKAQEAVKDVAEAAEKTVKTAKKTVRRAAGIRIKDVTIEIFETSVSLSTVEKAVKKAVADKGLTGEVNIYLNAERRAAYYTVNGEGSEEYKVDLKEL